MRINEHNILIENFGEVYAGYKLEIFSSKKILELCQKKIIIKSNPLREFELEEAYNESLYHFVDKIKQFCNEDEENKILFNENDNTSDLSYIPDSFFRIWRLESLLSISAMNISDEEKLDKIYEFFYFFTFPKEWSINKFIRYSLKDKNIMYNDRELINNLDEYIKREIIFFKNNQEKYKLNN